MLYFLVTRQHSYTIRWFLADWGSTLGGSIKVVPFRDFLRAKKLPASSYVFSDIERVPAAGIKALEDRWQRLETSTRCGSLLNQPGQVLKRFDLLRTLNRVGINKFNVYDITEGRSVKPETFPVFVREANEHLGPYGGLIHNQTALDETIAKLAEAGKLSGQPIVTEFVDTSDSNGIFRKYGAFRIGEHIVPTHLYFHDQWFVKSTNSELDKAMVEEEWAYVRENPHEETLKKIFELANIDYGRIDYSLVDDRIQVFEINTNPVIMRQGISKNADRLERKRFVAGRLIDAFRSIGA